LFSRQSS